MGGEKHSRRANSDGKEDRDKVKNHGSPRRRLEKERIVDDKYGEKYSQRDSRRKESEKDRTQSREENRERDDDGKDRSRKRRKRENGYEEKERKQDGSRLDRHRDDNEGVDTKEKRPREEEHRKLDDEIDKRRRRVRKWHEFKRKKEESERGVLKQGEANYGVPRSGKNWTLDEKSAKLDNDVVMDLGEDSKAAVDGGDSKGKVTLRATEIGRGGPNGEEEEIDPFDAFMNSIVLPEVEKLNNAESSLKSDDKKSNTKGLDQEDSQVINGDQPKKIRIKSLGRIIQGVDSDSDSDNGDSQSDDVLLEDEDDEEFVKRVTKTKAEKSLALHNSNIQYPSFRKKFYIEVKEISRMTSEEVVSYRKQLELKLHGKDVPKPIKTWIQTGSSSKICDTINKLGYEKPMPIQAQALPIIMSGRDCIGVAKTGSGKTLAFVLPMLRHIKDQPPVVPGDGPIGLIMAPTRELVQQIHSDIKKFAKVVGVNSVPVYGGSGVAQQISELKRGAEIVVCTPGRMIDILCTSNGKITNLRRVTYLVMDEADRMFDMGFEPQITRILQNTRPDRQTVLFSATFPHKVEILARKVLTKPVEIQVGGRNAVNKDISQSVEVRPDNQRFLRLLELLGEWYEKGKILIFVHSQEKCDSLFRDLLNHGYPCLSLHGSKDQTDRESTISDFKSNVCNVLIATSIAARGLDVKDLELVINFDVPNHYEDYVHRVGRTGRAGRKGCAITFISEENARYAPDLVKALELSEQAVPKDLKALADGFMEKVNKGIEQTHGTGYGGSGFQFNKEEDEVRKASNKAKAREYGFEEVRSDSDSEDEGIRKAGGDLSLQAADPAAASKLSMALTPSPILAAQLLPNRGIPLTLHDAIGLPVPATSLSGTPLSIATKEQTACVAALNLQHKLAKIQASSMPEHYETEFEINDFPQNVRWKVTHKKTLGQISEWTGAAITTRGQHYPLGKIPGPGERKLYLYIEGPTESSVKKAKAEVKRILEDITEQSISLPGAPRPDRGKYSSLCFARASTPMYLWSHRHTVDNVAIEMEETQFRFYSLNRLIGNVG